MVCFVLCFPPCSFNDPQCLLSSPPALFYSFPYLLPFLLSSHILLLPSLPFVFLKCIFSCFLLYLGCTDLPNIPQILTPQWSACPLLQHTPSARCCGRGLGSSQEQAEAVLRAGGAAPAAMLPPPSTQPLRHSNLCWHRAAAELLLQHSQRAPKPPPC